MGQKILVVEDEDGIVHLINLYLRDAGYQVIVAKDGAGGLSMHASENPDLIILDIMLPMIDGFEVCRRIRAWSNTPILILTARGDENDRIQGFDLGADDYLVKPFSPRELVSRVRAILRRGQREGGAQEQNSAGSDQGNADVASRKDSRSDILCFSGLSIDLLARRVEVDEHEISLTPTEFDLLALLAGSPDRVFTREVLMNDIWGYDYLGDGHTIDVHISALRKKVETSEHHYIKTVWRVGYRFEAKPFIGAKPSI